MLSIRFARQGKPKHPLYSLIVVEKSKDLWGDYVEKLGTYNPHDKAANFNAERINYWLGIGAQPTPTVHNLLVSQGIVKAEKVRAGKSQPGKKRAAEIEAAKQAAVVEAKAKTVEVPAEETPTAEAASVEAPAEKVVTE